MKVLACRHARFDTEKVEQWQEEYDVVVLHDLWDDVAGGGEAACNWAIIVIKDENLRNTLFPGWTSCHQIKSENATGFQTPPEGNFYRVGCDTVFTRVMNHLKQKHPEAKITWI